mgnify:CR=1 FL=1
MEKKRKRRFFSRGVGKRIVSVVLALAMVVTLSPMVPGEEKVSKAALTNDQIRSRIYDLWHKLDGKYFTVNQKRCGTGLRGHGCSNCYNENVINTTWFKNMFGNVNVNQFPDNATLKRASSCAGFVSFAEWYIFKNSNADTVSTNKIGEFGFNYTNMSRYAKIGDILRLGGSHSVILIDVRQNDITVLNCNYEIGNGNCKVSVDSIKYNGGYSKAAIYRANNSGPAPISPQPVDYSNPDMHHVPTTTLRVGSSGSSVYWVQAICNKCLNSGLVIDGQFGNKTKNAVMDFQRKFGLTVDGIVGQYTRAKMIEWWNSTKTIYPTSISIGGGSSDLTVGYSMQLSANVQPSNATNKTVTWSSSNNGVATVSNGTVRAVKAGSVTITASTHNGKKATKTISVHDPCVVRFVNDDGTLISEQKVQYGGSAKAPSAPAKVGHTFSGWNGKYQGVKSNSEVKATYTRNKYKVDFKYSNGTKIIDTQTILYDDAATAPKEEEVEIPDGYKFNGWSDEFDHIASNLTVYPVFQWADDELPMVVSAAQDSCKADYDEGIYSLSFTVKNHSEKARNAKIMTYMSTDEGKLVAQGETRTIRVPARKGDTDGSKVVDDMVISCKAAADKARILVLDDYESAVPLAEIKDISVEAAGYGKWTDRTPTDADVNPLERDVYRTKAVSYTSSSSSTLTGWTKYATDTSYNYGNWVYAGTGKTSVSTDVKKSEFISPNPDPNGGSQNYMASFNAVSVIRKGQSGAQVCALQAMLINLGYSIAYDGAFGSGTEAAVKRFQSDHGLTADGLAGSATKTALVNAYNNIPRYKYYTRTKTTVYTYRYYKIDDSWSDWTDVKPSGDTTLKAGTTKVLYETGKQYRYKEFESDNSGTTLEKTFAIPEEAMSLAGKNAVAIIFKNKVSQISEDNVEYIGDTKIGADGKIDLSFVPREELSYNGTGDYTVAIGIKGTTNYINVGKIEAPKPEYKVTFTVPQSGWTETQVVKEGEDAVAPTDYTLSEMYDFTGWDGDVTNIHSDKEILATYKYKKVNVTFVDWENRTIDQTQVDCAGNFALPDAPTAPEGKVFKGWKGLSSNSDDSSYTLTGELKDYVFEAIYEDETFEVTFVDNEGKIVDVQKVRAGEAAFEPMVSDEVEETVVADAENKKDGVVPENIHNKKFVSWGEDVDLSNITSNLLVGAVYAFDETVATPEASVKTGEYDSTQNVSLSTETEDAIIYYTTDGSDPMDVENAAVKIYSEPITVSDKTVIKFYATKMGMNDSSVVEEWYSINTTGNVPTHVVNIIPINQFDYTPIEAYRAFVKDGSKLDTSKMFTGIYTSIELDKIYYDEDLTDEWKENAETITESVTLYAVYDAKKYQVTYLDEDGNKIKDKMVKYGSSANDESIAPEKDGYRFTTWVLDESADHVTGAEDVNNVTKELIVKPKYVKEDEYTVISFGRKSYSIMADSSYSIKAKVVYELTGDVAEDAMIQWTSSDKSIAIVDENGVVNALQKGTVTIKGTLTSTGEFAECTVKVTGNPETSICLLSNSTYKLNDGILRNISLENNTVADIMKQLDSETLDFYGRSNNLLSDEDKVGTGTRIRMNNEAGEAIDEVTILITGDYSGDGKITNKDVSGVLRTLLSKESPDELQLQAVDVNGDGYVNNRDAAMLGRYLVGKEELE